ncbi:MAG: bifunctional riboflavin kinase/FAD synthetase [Lachnospiraceae bacterium]|nr:bifunctional riboflavin kinase/FAD synthetase [Lachnospiraceae bacterium]
MRIIQGTTDFKLENKSAVAIGKFDGMHLGHQKLLNKVLEQKNNGLISVIFTFDPAPEAFFRGRLLQGLMTKEEKRFAFDKLGIDVLIEFPMNKETAATEPERFVTEYLTGKLGAAVIVAGTDISFGNKGAGDAELLKRMAKSNGYHAEIIDKVTFEGQEISSTLIRDTVRRGDMESVTLLMGEPYQISGIVSHGRRFGRTIGMPTANLIPSGEKLLPPSGVYYSYAWVEGVRYKAISNVGCKPTVTDDKIMGVETYFYDFDDVIYGKELTVELLSFKRPEMKFENLEALKSQMQKDISEGRRYFEN